MHSLFLPLVYIQFINCMHKFWNTCIYDSVHTENKWTNLRIFITSRPYQINLMLIYLWFHCIITLLTYLIQGISILISKRSRDIGRSAFFQIFCIFYIKWHRQNSIWVFGVLPLYSLLKNVWTIYYKYIYSEKKKINRIRYPRNL